MVNGVDRTDLRIAAEMSFRARAPLSQIARRVGLSKEVVGYRVKEMQRKGFLKQVYPIVNYPRLGFLYAKLYLRFQNADLKKEEEIIKFFKESPKTNWMITSRGRWQIIVGIDFRNVLELSRFVDDAMEKFGKYFSDRVLEINIDDHTFKRKYLGTESPDLHFDPKDKIKIDAVDYRLLRVLSQNARDSSVDIARKVRVSPEVVKYRIKKMVENNIILAFNLWIDYSQLGRQYCKMLLWLEHPSPENKKRLIEFARNHPSVIYVIESMGPWDLEMDFEEKPENIDDFVRTLRTRFAGVLKDYELMTDFKEHKIHPVPLMPEFEGKK